MMPDNPTPDFQVLFELLKNGPLTVWATLMEDSYETSVGDGYYAYVDKVFLTPTEAARAIENARPEGMTKLHIRRYDLNRSDDKIRIIPAPTEQEPTTVEMIAAKLGHP